MKILVAGATGALGRQLLPRLVARGHEVTALIRDRGKAEMVRGLGAAPALADALHAEAVGGAVAEAGPEVVVHQLTALAGSLDLRRMDRSFAETNRLRTLGTDHLLSAARAAGARRFVAQSFAGWTYGRGGIAAKPEGHPLDPDPLPATRETLAALRHLEHAVTGASDIEGLVLRYGGFYGPGTSLAADGDIATVLRGRRFPVIGRGSGVWSFIHVEDAAEATVLAIEGGAPGVYNIVDDEPAPVSEWLPAAARAVGAPPPRHLPRPLGRLLAGDVVTVMMNDVRGASNEKARRELGWRPQRSSWRQGFAELAG